MSVSGLPVVEGAQAQAALRAEVGRVVDLLRSVRTPAAPAVGAWSLAEVAMHLSQAFLIVPALARGDLSAVHELLPINEEMLDSMALCSTARRSNWMRICIRCTNPAPCPPPPSW